MVYLLNDSIAYPPPSTAPGPYVVPPLAGYRMSKVDGQQYSQNPVAVKTKSKVVLPCAVVVFWMHAFEDLHCFD
ncbi:hypothetical protein CRYUN_Cryun35bG0092600 [Craigia yunnanensis]